MFCEQTNCNTAGDSIKIFINGDNKTLVNININYSNIGQQKVWQKMTAKFNLQNTNIEEKKEIIKKVKNDKKLKKKIKSLKVYNKKEKKLKKRNILLRE